jgi:hypothetical protein
MPFRMSPQYLTASGSVSAGCMAPSNALTWTIIGIGYQNNTYSNQWVGPSRGRWLNLDIMNNAGSFLVKCRICLDPNPFSPPANFKENCWVDPYKSWQDPPQIGNIWTDFSFSELDYSVSISQTWFCEDLGNSESYVPHNGG